MKNSKRLIYGIAGIAFIILLCAVPKICKTAVASKTIPQQTTAAVSVTQDTTAVQETVTEVDPKD